MIDHNIEVEYHHHLARFEDAARDLLTPWPVTTMQGHEVIMPPLVDHMSEGRVILPGDGGAGGYDSRPPIWVGALDWQAGIIKTVTKLDKDAPHFPTPRHALDWAIGEASWGPQHAALLDRAATRLEQARWEGLRLLWPEAFTLNAACPECGVTHSYRPGDGGGRVRGHALVVRELFAECTACNVVWWGADMALGLATALQAAEDRQAMLDDVQV